MMKSYFNDDALTDLEIGTILYLHGAKNVETMKGLMVYGRDEATR